MSKKNRQRPGADYDGAWYAEAGRIDIRIMDYREKGDEYQVYCDFDFGADGKVLNALPEPVGLEDVPNALRTLVKVAIDRFEEAYPDRDARPATSGRKVEL